MVCRSYRDSMCVLALGLEASSGIQDPRFLPRHLFRAHRESRTHHGHTGDGLGVGCPQLSNGPGHCIRYIKATQKKRGWPPSELSDHTHFCAHRRPVFYSLTGCCHAWIPGGAGMQHVGEGSLVCDGCGQWGGIKGVSGLCKL